MLKDILSQFLYFDYQIYKNEIMRSHMTAGRKRLSFSRIRPSGQIEMKTGTVPIDILPIFVL